MKYTEKDLAKSIIEPEEIISQLKKEGSRDEILNKSIINVLIEISDFSPSRNERNRTLKENSISVNQQKVTADYVITENDIRYYK